MVVPQVQAPGTRYSAAALSPDGDTLVAGQLESGVVDVWRTETGTLLRSISAHRGSVIEIEFVDDTHVVTAGSDGSYCRFTLTDNAPPDCKGGTFTGVASAAASRDGKWVVLGGKHDRKLFTRNHVTVVDAAKGKRRRRVRQHFGAYVNAVAVSPDGRLMVSAGEAQRKRRASDRIQLRELPGGKLVRHLAPPDISQVYQLAFSPDGRYVVGSTISDLRVWSVDTGQSVRTISGATAFAFSRAGDAIHASTSSGIVTFAFPSFEELGTLPSGPVDVIAPGGPHTIVSTRDGTLTRWDTRTGKPQVAIAANQSFTNARFTEDGRRALLVSEGGTWSLDLELLSLRRTNEPPPADRGPYAIAEGGHASNFVIWERNTITLRERGSNREIGTIGSPTPFGAIAFSRDGRRMLTGQTGFESSIWWWDFVYQAQLWDVATGELLRTFDAPPDGVSAAAISRDARYGALGGADFTRGSEVRRSRGGSIRYVDLSSGKVVRDLVGHTRKVLSVDFSPDGRYLLSTSADGTARLWNLESGKSVAMVAAGSEWLVYGDDGYFDASRYGHNLVAAVRGLRAFGIDQLAPRNNRPDLLLTSLGLGTPEVIEHFEARHRRRLRQLGLDESRLATDVEAAPVAQIGAVRVDAGQASLAFDVEDAKYDLLRYHVWVNGVPVAGPGGKPVTGRRAQLTETFPLGPGRNKIEVSVVNAAGVESLRDFRVVESDVRPKAHLYYLGFGVSRYRDNRLDLQFAHQDALDLEAVLGGMRAGPFEEVHTKTFVDEQVTVDNIRAAREFLARATPHDTVILFVAGHGTHGTDSAAEYYYVTHETDPSRLAETAAPFEVIEDLLASTPARQKLFLLDTCESGEREDDDPASAGIPGAAGRGVTPRTTRALALNTAGPGAQAAAPRPRRWLLERERYIYNDLARRTGAIVFASSRGSEFSYERSEFRNGVFTEVLVEALTTPVADRDGNALVDTEELRTFVAERVAALTERQQNPTIDRDNREIRVVLPIAAPVTAPEPEPPSEPTPEPEVGDR